MCLRRYDLGTFRGDYRRCELGVGGLPDLAHAAFAEEGRDVVASKALLRSHQITPETVPKRCSYLGVPEAGTGGQGHSWFDLSTQIRGILASAAYPRRRGASAGKIGDLNKRSAGVQTTSVSSVI